MTIREALVDWLTGGRYDRIYARLADSYRERLADKDAQIRLLRVELARARNERLPVFEMPKAAPVVELARTPELPLDWPGELAKMLKEEEDGIRKRGRIQEHEPGADDGAQALDGA